MARIHSRKKGKHSSKKPSRKNVPVWVKQKPKEIEELVVELAKKGRQSSAIGMILRDSHGIPDVKMITGKKMTQIMKDNKAYPELPEDIINLITKVTKLRKHLESHKKDLHSARGLQLLESKIKRLTDYYKRKGRVDPKWTYNWEQVKILAE